MGDKTTMRMKIFLIGYMGCGKSSLGRRLAKRAGMRFVDMDSEIEQREGASISDIFRFEGEDYFRRKERELIESLAGEGDDMVISTGGGAPAWGGLHDGEHGRARTLLFAGAPVHRLRRQKRRRADRVYSFKVPRR